MGMPRLNIDRTMFVDWHNLIIKIPVRGDMKISVIGAGYVGLSLAVLLSRKHEVVTLDVVPEKIDMINRRISPISDKDIDNYFLNENLNLLATLDYDNCMDSDYFIVATPTDYDPESNSFNTTLIENALDNIKKTCPEAAVVIKSTVPIGYSESILKKRKISNLIYSPEFLREGRSLHDNLHPSRIVVGTADRCRESAERFAEIIRDCSMDDDVKVLITGYTEAESIKLFSNSYLAMRVSFFNELDSFAEINELNSEDIIRGVSLDPRIGEYYNNPSFGYGGYCLPKDTMQLRSSYGSTPHTLISAIIQSNDDRKMFVADRIASMASDTSATIGAFRLNMKAGSDNSRKSSILDVIEILKERGFKIVAYEPTLKQEVFCGYRNILDIEEFKRLSDVIVANRLTNELVDVSNKVYSRDIYNRD